MIASIQQTQHNTPVTWWPTTTIDHHYLRYCSCGRWSIKTSVEKSIHVNFHWEPFETLNLEHLNSTTPPSSSSSSSSLQRGTTNVTKCVSIARSILLPVYFPIKNNDDHHHHHHHHCRDYDNFGDGVSTGSITRCCCDPRTNIATEWVVSSSSSSTKAAISTTTVEIFTVFIINIVHQSKAPFYGRQQQQRWQKHCLPTTRLESKPRSLYHFGSVAEYDHNREGTKTKISSIGIEVSSRYDHDPVIHSTRKAIRLGSIYKNQSSLSNATESTTATTKQQQQPS